MYILNYRQVYRKLLFIIQTVLICIVETILNDILHFVSAPINNQLVILI